MVLRSACLWPHGAAGNDSMARTGWVQPRLHKSNPQTTVYGGVQQSLFFFLLLSPFVIVPPSPRLPYFMLISRVSLLLSHVPRYLGTSILAIWARELPRPPACCVWSGTNPAKAEEDGDRREDGSLEKMPATCALRRLQQLAGDRSCVHDRALVFVFAPKSTSLRPC